MHLRVLHVLLRRTFVLVQGFPDEAIFEHVKSEGFNAREQAKESTIVLTTL
jgi:hypothetical protein